MSAWVTTEVHYWSMATGNANSILLFAVIAWSTNLKHPAHFPRTFHLWHPLFLRIKSKIWLDGRVLMVKINLLLCTCVFLLLHHFLFLFACISLFTFSKCPKVKLLEIDLFVSVMNMNCSVNCIYGLQSHFICFTFWKWEAGASMESEFGMVCV